MRLQQRLPSWARVWWRDERQTATLQGHQGTLPLVGGPLPMPRGGGRPFLILQCRTVRRYVCTLGAGSRCGLCGHGHGVDVRADRHSPCDRFTMPHLCLPLSLCLLQPRSEAVSEASRRVAFAAATRNKHAEKASNTSQPTTNSIPRVVAAVVPGIPACTRSFRRLTSSMTHRYLCTSPDTGTWPSAARSLGRDRLSGGHVPALPPGRRVQQSVHSFSCLSHPALQ